LSLVKAVERATGIEPALPVWKAAVKRTLWVQPAPIVSAPATLIAFFTAVDSVSCHEPCHATHAVRDCLFLQRRHKGYIRTRRVTGSGWEASHSPTGGDTSARLLDVVADRSASALVGWTDQREPEWREAIATAALDPYRGYASARSRSRCSIDDCVLAGLSGRPLAARGEHRRIQQPLRAGPPPRRSDTSSAPPPADGKVPKLPLTVTTSFENTRVRRSAGRADQSPVSSVGRVAADGTPIRKIHQRVSVLRSVFTLSGADGRA
jgi:hypothetical protein